MTQTAKAQEPSMEEILASIRRIIADDDASKATKPPEAPAPKPAPAPPPAAAAPVKPVAPPPPPQRQPPPPNAGPAAGCRQQSERHRRHAGRARSAGKACAKPAPTPASDVLDLTEAMAAPPPSPTPAPGPAPTFRTIDGASDVVFADRPPEPEPPPPPVRALEETRRAFAPPPPASPGERSLLSNSASAAVDHAFNTLAQTMLVNNARTIEDLVKEMLRPMLKNWLDDNLPGLVERIVRAEIERVSRGRP